MVVASSKIDCNMQLKTAFHSIPQNEH